MSSKTLPSIKSLFKESFHALKKVIAPFIVFNIIVIVTTSIAVTLMVLGFILLGIGAGFSGIFTDSPLSWGLGAVSAVAIIIIVVSVISSVAQIGSIIILNEGSPRMNVFSVIKRSAKFIIPLLLVGFITGFLTLGGFLLFIIPGFIFSLFLTFTLYSVITENKSPISAIRRSVFLVKNNFGAFFLRLLSIWGVVLLINITLSIILGAISQGANNEGLTLAISILNIVIQILTSWFSLAFMITLFKHLKQKSGDRESSLKVFTIIAIVGWVIAIISGYLLVNTVSNFINEYQEGDFREGLTPEESEQFNKLFEEFEDEFNIEDLDKYIEEIDVRELETPSTPEEAI